ncbi:histidyl-tRNA synthetase [Catalinimonas alkaloidigena]|uniref:Histidine--tRNA ligase n=1 Tax=Catalinimonas alkaloidigena TaxID=1075417 RepID=A0A1G8XYD8_9BACT|nr:histidine--tRNA ligase [Catalinimonas alkaloidigena]SDJ95497.1 histidyl-tRNA synthetase [Catalinimonas alkaloidigena]
MSKAKPAIPRGTRDFGPAEMIRRNYIFDTIRRTFRTFGYLPLETPSMENLSVLMGKYGEEGDRLIFKILNSGDYFSHRGTPVVSPEDVTKGESHFTSLVSEKALRYDLTVPFARYVVMHRHELTFPFRRYQIQPVWRADSPQKGRYREFYQCDADVVGTDSLLCEAEIVQMIREVMERLGLTEYAIKFNNRKVLTGITEVIGCPGQEAALCVAIDKLDKIGREGVVRELESRGFDASAIAQLEPVFQLQGSLTERIEQLSTLLANSLVGQQGLDEIREMLRYLELSGEVPATLEFDATLARGLSYYTGMIFEVKVTNVQIGSISGGGRYDNLTGVFGLEGVSGVGFSFGVDRIYDVLETLGLFPDQTHDTTQVLIVNFGAESEPHALPLLAQLREANVAAELYPDAAKIKKQMTYANAKNIPYVVLIGSDEIARREYTLKNMQTGEQQSLSAAALVQTLAAADSVTA